MVDNSIDIPAFFAARFPCQDLNRLSGDIVKECRITIPRLFCHCPFTVQRAFLI